MKTISSSGTPVRCSRSFPGGQPHASSRAAIERGARQDQPRGGKDAPQLAQIRGIFVIHLGIGAVKRDDRRHGRIDEQRQQVHADVPEVDVQHARVEPRQLLREPPRLARGRW